MSRNIYLVVTLKHTHCCQWIDQILLLHPESENLFEKILKKTLKLFFKTVTAAFIFLDGGSLSH